MVSVKFEVVPVFPVLILEIQKWSFKFTFNNNILNGSCEYAKCSVSSQYNFIIWCVIKLLARLFMNTTYLFLVDTTYNWNKLWGVLDLKVFKVSRQIWQLNKFWKAKIPSLLNNGLVCSFQKNSAPSLCASNGRVRALVLNLSKYFYRSPNNILM